MGAIIVIGEPELVAGYAMAGVTVVAAQRPDEVIRAWENLPPGTTLVILTTAAAAALPAVAARAAPLVAVLPP